MKKLKTALAALIMLLLTAAASSALADAVADPIDYIVYDNSWFIYFIIGVSAVALGVLIFTIIRIRRNRK